MGTPEDPTRQTLEKRERAGPGTRDSNPARAATEELAEAKVELAIELLLDLREVQDQLERYVRVYIEAGERLVRCGDMLETLRHSPLADSDWRAVKRDLDHTRPLCGGEVSRRRVPEEAQQLASDFDEKLNGAQEEMRVALGVPSPDYEHIRDEVYNAVWQMSEATRQLAETCRVNAEEWLNEIGKALSRIFGRIDQQMEARHTATPGEARASSADRESGEPTTLNVGSERASPPQRQRSGFLSFLKGES